MSNGFNEKRSEPRTNVNQYYSVDFSVGTECFLYQFKIWNLSSKGLCILVKEHSEVLKHIEVGDIINMKYYEKDASKPGKYLKTEIKHITKDEEGPFKGHSVLGIMILEDSNSK